MYHFFVEPNAISGKTVTITGKDVNHIKNVLRMKKGEEISVSSTDSSADYHCLIESLSDECVTAEVIFVKEEGNELPAKIFLFQGLPKQDKMELIIQKCVELGVFKIIPVNMKRSIMKIDEKKVKTKTERWQSISEAAAKQSKRTVIPEIKEPVSFKNAITMAGDCNIKLLPYEMATAEGMEKTRALFDNVKPGDSVAIFIGPEGGFDDSEVNLAKEAGFEIITLGKRILRTETAGLVVLSNLMMRLE
ncbi:MAG: 16S rRNA (uracil(1498)-N(3))-methyltransferase [Lachnospiraceae bacterium]|nr:16S rRNA (uracil(1498)-N(3))-methyltransferase [Lachnospiraceae bacterium]